MRIEITDRQTYRTSSREYTDEGFLRVPAKVARTGIQEYLARELQLPGDPNRIVRVMRPPEEVFAPESLESLNGVDVTIHHPKEGVVTSKTFKRDSIGNVKGPGKQDGDFVNADLIIKDENGIKRIESGLVEVSCGYSAVYDDQVPEGSDYEMIQREIRHNHVAIVDNARAGYQARISDSKPKVEVMEKVTLDSGRTVEIEDPSKAALIADSIARYQKALNEMNEDNESLKIKNSELEKLTSDSAIKAKVKAVSKRLEDAKLIAGSSFVCDSTDLTVIAKEALLKSRPEIDWNDRSETFIESGFEITFIDAKKKAKDEEEKEEMEDEDYEEEMKDRKKSKDSNQYLGLANDASKIGNMSGFDARRNVSEMYKNKTKTMYKRG